MKSLYASYCFVTYENERDDKIYKSKMILVVLHISWKINKTVKSLNASYCFVTYENEKDDKIYKSKMILVVLHISWT